EGVRVDAGYSQGNAVTPFYDPMIAKLIVSGKDRSEAIARARGAVEGFHIEGIKHNLPLHARILADETFHGGTLDTHFLEHHAKPVAGRCVPFRFQSARRRCQHPIPPGTLPERTTP